MFAWGVTCRSQWKVTRRARELSGVASLTSACLSENSGMAEVGGSWRSSHLIPLDTKSQRG